MAITKIVAGTTNAADAATSINSAIDLAEAAVSVTGAQTVAGVKTFSASPVVPTPAVNDSSTAVANTAWFIGQQANAVPVVNGTAAIGSALHWAKQDHVHPTDTTRAPLASPSFTGTVAVPVPTVASAAVRKDYVDARVTNLATSPAGLYANVVNVASGVGTPDGVIISSGTAANSIAMRSGSGQIQAIAGVADTDVANMSQLNARLSSAQRTAINALPASGGTYDQIVAALKAT